MPKRPPFQPARQRGVALVVGLVILVLLALMGTAAYSVVTQEERMAGNARDHARAFEAAEAALRECEQAVFAGPAFDGTNGMYRALASGLWLQGQSDLSTLTSPPIAPPAGSTAAGAVQWSQAPRCVAESFDPHLPGPAGGMGTVPTLHAARVTATGFGVNSNTQVTLVSYVTFYQ